MIKKKYSRVVKSRTSNESETDFRNRMLDLFNGLNIFYEDQGTKWEIMYMYTKGGTLKECIFSEVERKKP